MNNNLAKKYLFLVMIIVVASFFVGWQVGLGQYSEVDKVSGLDNKDTPENISADFEPFWQAWNTLNNKYVATGDAKNNISDQERVWGAIRGLADSLNDPYTIFLPPEDASRFESDISGNFEGVGMEVGIRDGVLTVVSPLKGTPAYDAGILAGDKILQIDSVSTNKLNINEAVDLIRGERGTEVTFTIFREGVREAFEISVRRDVIDMPILDTEIVDGIFVIRLYSFPSSAPSLFREAIGEYSTSGLDKMVLDLRGNPGGFLQASVDIASWFLPAGKVVVKEDYRGNRENIVHRSKGHGSWRDGDQLVVLINGGSASASEIVAGSLREHGKAVLVGENTFGKGSVQEVVKITPDTALKITIAEWLTPGGESFSDSGIVPDFEVERTAEDVAEGIDPQMDKAIDILLNQ